MPGNCRFKILSPKCWFGGFHGDIQIFFYGTQQILNEVTKLVLNLNQITVIRQNGQI